MALNTTRADATRLHVTPLDASLLPVVLNPLLLPLARNVSYHTLDTFPEKRYGFLDLPCTDAERLRKKLHGAVLKGVKMRVETARKEGMPKPLGEDMALSKKERKARKYGKIKERNEMGVGGGKAIDDLDLEGRKDKKSSMKRKRNATWEEWEGVELEKGRKVKRGWTVPAYEIAKVMRKKTKDKKRKKEKGTKGVRSKYTDHAECLFKTILPSKRDASVAKTESGQKRNSRSREVVLHEFEKSTKFPTFLKSATSTWPSKAPAEFVEGKGWVGEDGIVVETVKRSRPDPQTKAQKTNKEDINSDSLADEQTTIMSVKTNALAVIELVQPPPSATKTVSWRPNSSVSPRIFAIKKLSRSPTPTTSIHPLEALYKRPKPTGEDQSLSQAQTQARPFSFFGDSGPEEPIDYKDDAGAQSPAPQKTVPMTPFTRQDFEERSLRSAAPTQDTNHLSRRLRLWTPREKDDVEEDVDVDEKTGESMNHGFGESNATTDFLKWFWEHRGELNRSWKKRRKMATKEKRYRERKAI